MLEFFNLSGIIQNDKPQIMHNNDVDELNEIP